MNRTNVRRARATLVVGVAVALRASTASAETLEAPVSGHAVRVSGGRVACKDPSSLGGWAVEGDGHFLRPPARAEDAGQSVSAWTAAADADCATNRTALTLIALGPTPSVDRSTLVLDPEGGRVTVRGTGLRGAVLRWTAGERSGDDACPQPEVAAGVDTCAFSVPRTLPADPTAVRLSILPAGAVVAADATLFDAAGRPWKPDDVAVPPARVEVTRIVAPEATVDVSSGTGRIALVHPEAIASADCGDATCEVEGSELVVRGEHGADDKLDVRLQLRPRVVLRGPGGTYDTSLTANLVIQRCPVSLASAPPLVGVPDQRVVVRVGGSCARDPHVELTVGGSVASVERTATVGDALYVVAHVQRVEAGAFAVTVRRRGSILGTVRATPQRGTVHTRVEIEQHGAIDFIPTNRWARVTFSIPPQGGAFIAAPVDSVYDVKKGSGGESLVRAVDGATGSASLHALFVDPRLPKAFDGLVLADVQEAVERQLRPVNVPVPLGALVLGQKPLAEVLCGDGDGHVKRIEPSTTASIPYRARDTCRLVIHRADLRPEDGAQVFTVTVRVVASDGLPRTDARVERRLLLRPGPEPTILALSGAVAPFDRFLVRLGVASDEAHYATSETVTATTEAQWSVVNGTDHVRLYATAAIPTGLFRVADSGHSGILTLSAGALLRGVWLSREGNDFPVGLETGIMWLGIAGDTDAAAASHGAIALVFGPGISVPIANVSRATQASIGLHGWFEYEVSRALLHQAGQPAGFVFGPSLSIGDVGTNF